MSPVEIDVGNDGRTLVVTTDDQPGTRARLVEADVSSRRREGRLIVSLSEAPKMLRRFTDWTWTDKARRLGENRTRVLEAADGVRDQVAQVRLRGADGARATISDCAIADQLDDHQVLNVACLTVDGTWGGCVFDEQGTGKTVTLIATFDVLVERGLADTLLVVAPKSMVAEWRQEFQRFTGDLYRVAVAEGDRRAKAMALYSRADVIVVNYETLVSLQADIVRLARRTRLCLAVDESYNVKNPDALRSGAAVAVREWCTHAFVLCGTPAPNRANDIVAQFDLVDFGMTFGAMRLDDDVDVARTQIAQRLQDRGLFVRNLKAQVLTDLPAKSFTEVEVNLAPQQQLAYDSAARDLIIDLEAADDETYRRQIENFLERRAALLRICADPSPIIPGYDELPAKIGALDDVLHQLVESQGEKVVLWSFYRSSLDRIAERYSHLGLVRVDGSVTQTDDRREAVRRFQQDPDTMIFLGNPAAAGAGLTLHSARYAVYESLSNQAAHYLQSLDRIHRRGQERDVRYLTLLASGTVEEAEYQRLRTKASAQADLLGDPLDSPPTRRMLLDELVRSTSTRAGVP